jgi:hypothetical protein
MVGTEKDRVINKGENMPQVCRGGGGGGGGAGKICNYRRLIVRRRVVDVFCTVVGLF